MTLGTFCGTDRPPNVETYSNEVKLTFHTDGNSDHNTGCGSDLVSSFYTGWSIWLDIGLG